MVMTLTETLTVDDLAKITKSLDEHINQDDNIPNLVLHLSKMPHWDGFQALKEHLKLVKDHALYHGSFDRREISSFSCA
jgi:hypothetical protein